MLLKGIKIQTLHSEIQSAVLPLTAVASIEHRGELLKSRGLVE